MRVSDSRLQKHVVRSLFFTLIKKCITGITPVFWNEFPWPYSAVKMFADQIVSEEGIEKEKNGFHFRIALG